MTPADNRAGQPLRFEHGLAWLFVWAALDQTCKWAVVHGWGLREGQAHPVLPFLDMSLVWNTGISYGLFGGSGDTGRWLLSLLAALAIGIFVYFLRTSENRVTGMAYALIAGGALGNLVDRVWYGAVVDFVSLHWNGYYWYVFNLADVWISAAVILLLFDAFRPQNDAE